MVRKREPITGQGRFAGSSHTALNPGSGWGKYSGGKTFPRTLKKMDPSTATAIRQVELCLLETGPFISSIPSTSMCLAVIQHCEQDLAPVSKQLVASFVLTGFVCILPHQMALMDCRWELTGWIKEFIFLVYYNMIWGLKHNPYIWSSGTIRLDKGQEW